MYIINIYIYTYVGYTIIKRLHKTNCEMMHLLRRRWFTHPVHPRSPVQNLSCISFCFKNIETKY